MTIIALSIAALNAPVAVGAAASRDIERRIASWPVESKIAARDMIQRFGSPDDATDRMLLWYDRGLWKRITVFRDAAKDDYPFPHRDYVEHTVDYLVPQNRVAGLLQFDQALVVDLVRGTLSSISSGERENTIALNLADEIVRNKRSTSAARDFMRETLVQEASGKSSPYTERLLFTPLSRSETPPTATRSTMGTQPREESSPKPPR